MSLTLHKNLYGVHKGEPDERLPIGMLYYTTFFWICKLSILTKMKMFFRQNAYEVENNSWFNQLFCTKYR